MKNLENLTKQELRNIEAGYSWYEFGGDLRNAYDWCHGVIDELGGLNC